MRSAFGFGSPTPNVTLFLIIIIASYLAFALFGSTQIGALLYQSLMLTPRDVVNSYQIWRIFSYGFLHDVSSPMHVIFNALLLYMLGPQLEDRWGEKRFLIFILTAVGLGGALVVLCYVVGLSNAVVVGFSAATVAMVIAWGLTFPTQQIFLLGIVPISGQQLVYVTVGLEILYAVSSNSISSAAHFGGILAGFIFTLGLYKPQRLKQIWRQTKNKMRQ